VSAQALPNAFKEPHLLGDGHRFNRDISGHACLDFRFQYTGLPER
jgi:hypothetical protein